jgi:tRNA (guanine37-N1)-methyltransferase
MTFHIISIFPEAFSSYLNESILARAQMNKKIKVKFYNPRDFTKDKWKKVDDKPYAGGPGMVMYAEPILRAVEKALKGVKDQKKAKVILFSPSGNQFDNKYARAAEEVSVGPYVLTGGELPAMLVIDSISRQIPGVLGKYESLEEERVSSSEMYTRPESLTWKSKSYKVPKVLLSGDHKKIEAWKKRG